MTSVSTGWFEFNQYAAGGIGSLADMQPVEISTVITGDVQRWLDGLKLRRQLLIDFHAVFHRIPFASLPSARGYIFNGNKPVGRERKA